MDFSASTTSWIYGFKSGTELNSNSLSATIQQHDSDGYGTFQFSSTAQGGSDSNPFLSSSNSTNSSAACTSASQDAVSEAADGVSSMVTPTATYATVTATVTQTQAKNGSNNNNGNSNSNNNNGNSNSNNNNGNGNSNNNNNSDKNKAQATHKRAILRGLPLAKRGETAEMIVKRQTSTDCSTNGTSGSSISQDSTSNSTYTMVITAHAVLACLAFALFFPIGGILIRVAQFNGTLWVHAGLQIAAYLVYTAAVGIGIWITQHPNFGELQNKHPIIGLFLFALLLFQAPAGWMHHVGYKKYGGRTFWSHIHLWIGRVAITLGIINAGFGFILRGTTGSGPIAYAVLATLIWIAYVLAIIYGERRRTKKLAKSVSPVQQRRASVKRDVFGADDERGLNEPTSMEMQMRPSGDHRPRHLEISVPSQGYYGGGSLGSHPAETR